MILISILFLEATDSEIDSPRDYAAKRSVCCSGTIDRVLREAQQHHCWIYFRGKIMYTLCRFSNCVYDFAFELYLICV